MRTTRPALSPAVTRLLLEGPSALHRGDEDDSELVALWRLGLPGMAAAWREHAATLEADGARRGVPRRWPRGRYFGQHLVAFEAGER